VSEPATLTSFFKPRVEGAFVGAGVLWIALAAWLLRTQPSFAHGQLGELRRTCEHLSPGLLAALAPGLVLGSYLIGSASMRMFGWLLGDGLDWLWPGSIDRQYDERVQRRVQQINALQPAHRDRAISTEVHVAREVRERLEVHTAALPPVAAIILYLTMAAQWSWIVGPAASSIIVLDMSCVAMKAKVAEAVAEKLTLAA
jgi:hypothetical protein